ncbi:MAG TPA: hypothetical protein VHX44_09240 [Planctomycetota bacterium]|nr:hypothetical protein [Planctomycetota bacterium]
MIPHPSSSCGPLLIAMFIALSVSGCVEIPRVTPELVTVAVQRDRTTTQERLEVGRSIYVNRCSSCHSLYSPDAYSESEWKSWVRRMGPKSHIDRGQEATLLVFLFAARDMVMRGEGAQLPVPK